MQMELFWYWIVLFSVIFANHIKEQRIYVQEGETFNISCDLNITPGLSVSWLIPPNVTQYAVGSSVLKKPEFANLELYIKHNILQITNFTTNNQGLYRCQTKDEETDVKIFIKADPKNITIKNETELGEITAHEGQAYELQCNVESGRPEENLSWSLDGTSLKEGGPGSVSYLLKPKKHHHNKNFTCQAFREENVILLERTVRLFLYHIPVVSVHSEPSTTVVEGTMVTLTCLHDSNDPQATVQWSPECRKKSFAGSSMCVIENVTRYHNNYFECEVRSRTGVVKNGTTLQIQYAPDVSISKENLNDNLVELVCNAEGIPNNTYFSRWEHKTTHGSHIRYLHNYSRIIMQTNSYNDTGIYVCNVTNNIPNNKGQMWIQKSFYMNYTGKPRFAESTKAIQYGKIGHENLVMIYVVSFYRITAGFDIQDTTEMIDEKLYEANIAIKDIVYGTWVDVFGYKLVFRVNITSESDFRNYTVYAENKNGRRTFNVEIKSADRPMTPSNVLAIAHQKSIEVVWNSGFNGGFPQRFVIQFRRNNANTWQSIKPIYESVLKNYTTRLTNLSPATKYCIQLFAVNSVNASDITDEICLHTTTTSAFLPIELVLPLFVSVLIVCCLVVWICYQTCSKKAQGENVPISQITPSYEDGENSRDNSNLNYIDVWFEPNSKKRKFRIHGADTRTQYADVDLNIKADPLPETSRPEEDDSGSEIVEFVF